MSKQLSPLKTIRKYCLECCRESAHEVKLCPAKDCPLYGYRLGKTGRTRVMSAQEKQELVERLNKSE